MLASIPQPNDSGGSIGGATYCLIRNNLLIEMIDVYLLLTMRCPQKINKVLLEFFAEVLDMFPRVFADQKHLADVALALYVAFESVFVAHLALTGLTVPS